MDGLEKITEVWTTLSLIFPVVIVYNPPLYLDIRKKGSMERSAMKMDFRRLQINYYRTVATTTTSNLLEARSAYSKYF